MAKASPRNYCKLDLMIWNHSGMRKLPKSAALAYVYLIAWSKCMKKDGDFDRFAVQQVGGSEEDLQALLKAEFVVPKEGEDDSFTIPKFPEWQVTTAEEERQQDVARFNGAKGGRPAKVEPEERDTSRDEWLNIAFGAWPEPSEPKYRENPDKVRASFYEAVANAEDWEKFQVALSTKIEDYDRRVEPRHVKRAYLGSFQKFCQSWRDVIVPTKEKPKKFEPPPAKAKPEGVKIVVQE